MYDWNTAKTACPAGWHLPSREEWNALATTSGGKAAGKALKSTDGWNENGNGTDKYGFSALPGGGRGFDGNFYGAGSYGDWWTATGDGSDGAYNRGIRYNGDNMDERDIGKNYGISVRCVGN